MEADGERTGIIEGAQARLFDLNFDAVQFDRAVEMIIDAAKERRKGLVVTPNVDQVIRFDRDPDMLEAYQSALFTFADGMPLVWLSQITPDKKLPERITGADLMPAVCAAAAEKGLSVFIFGGEPGVADLAAKKLCARFPALKVAGTACPPYGFENNPEESDKLVQQINDSGADLLFMGVGAPKQEKWGTNHAHRLQVGPMLCVGAAIGFVAEINPRAPLIFQRSGFEWLYRLLKEPRRLWRRYLVDDMRFFYLAAKQLQQGRRVDQLLQRTKLRDAA